MPTIKYPKKPALKKYRRKPKATAATHVLHNWLKHVEEVDKINHAKMKDWEARKKMIDAEKMARKKMAEKISGIGAVDYRNMWHKAPKRTKR